MMKNLTDFINEQLIMELSSDTYKSAFQKAKAKGDERADKFLAAYLKALQEETPEGDKLAEKITKWVNEDKQLILKLKESCDDSNSCEFYFYKKDDTKQTNYLYDKYKPFYVDFYVGHKNNDKFFYRFDNALDEDFSHMTEPLLARVFSDKYAKGNESKKFVIIQFNSSYYIYYINDKKLSFIDHIGFTDARPYKKKEDVEMTKDLKNMLNELGI